MTALSRRKISAWTCAACMAAIWGLMGEGAADGNKWIIGLITGAGLGITLSVSRTAPPLLPTLSICGILFTILVILTARHRPPSVLAGSIAIGAVFFVSQWAYIRAFRISGKDPAGIDPSRPPGGPL